jgi:hypothetical protein
VLTKDSVRSENTGVPAIREIMLATYDELFFRRPFRFSSLQFRTRAALQAEILVLSHQLAVCQKNVPRRLRFHCCDRLLWVACTDSGPAGGDVSNSATRHRPLLAPPSFRLALDPEIARMLAAISGPSEKAT